MIAVLVFYLQALFLLAGAGLTMFSETPLRATAALVLTCLALSGLFVVLDALALAGLLILLTCGGAIVTWLIATRTADMDADMLRAGLSAQKPLGIAMVLCVAVAFVSALAGWRLDPAAPPVTDAAAPPLPLLAGAAVLILVVAATGVHVLIRPRKPARARGTAMLAHLSRDPLLSRLPDDRKSGWRR